MTAASFVSCYFHDLKKKKPMQGEKNYVYNNTYRFTAVVLKRTLRKKKIPFQRSGDNSPIETRAHFFTNDFCFRFVGRESIGNVLRSVGSTLGRSLRTIVVISTFRAGSSRSFFSSTSNRIEFKQNLCRVRCRLG